MKFIKYSFGIAIGFVVFFSIIFYSVNQPLPDGQSGDEADELAHMMLDAINKDGYDSLGFISWTFEKAGHHFVWNKKENQVNVRWDDYEVDFSPETLQGIASKNGTSIGGKELDEVIQKAWAYFANDSFWLIAPFKLFDPGTIRKIVETEEGQALLITYQSGGVTPGDSYLWLLDKELKPKSWKLWTQIIPIGGVEFSWESWENHSGVWFATKHAGLINVDITDLKVNN